MNSMNQKIAPSVCLAPMAGFTDVSFRLLCREQGADGLFSEMVSAKGLLFESEKTKELLRIDPAEGPVTIQLFGHEPEVVLEGAKLALEIAGENCRGIDLNMGCPAPKITGNGDGSALMKNPILAGRIVEMLAKGIPLPVSVKFRAGWDAAHKNCIEFAKIMEESGAAFLTVHGRTREQQYAGKADLDCIAGVKAAVSIPVIGNGDVTDGPSARHMLSYTKCDGLAVGRGALGNPFVFREIRQLLRGETPTPATREERFSMALRHTEMVLKNKGPHGLVELRKHLPFYISGFPGASRLRVRLQQAKTLEEIREILT